MRDIHTFHIPEERIDTQYLATMATRLFGADMRPSRATLEAHNGRIILRANRQPSKAVVVMLCAYIDGAKQMARYLSGK